MKNFSELFRFYFARAGITQNKDIADKLGVDGSQVGRYLSGESRPSPEKVLAAAKLLKLTENEKNQLVLASFQVRADDVATQALGEIRHQLDVGGPPAGAVLPDRWEGVPVYQSIHCGEPDTEPAGTIVGNLPCFPGMLPHGSFAMVVEGESMNGGTEPVPPGAWAIFIPWTGQNLPIGDVVCCCVDGWPCAACKRLRMEPDGSLALCSDAPGYPPIIIRPGERRVWIYGVLWGSFMPTRRAEKGFSQARKG